MSSALFNPITIGEIELKNRIIMAPLTRCRASINRVPNEMMATYYANRASAGLIISEATSVSPMGVGYPDTPGIWSQEQIEGWKLVTNKVHNNGGKIFLQLWHVGRISDPLYLDGQLPVAPSAIAPSGHVNLVRPHKPFVTPRELRIDEIPGIIEEFRQGALNAKAAGFDGVEIHGANGYLLDQFLQDGPNKRTDSYGGKIENRARFMLEVTDAVIDVWGPGRVGMHLAPRGEYNSVGDSNRVETFKYVAKELGKRKIAFILSREVQDQDNIGLELKQAFGGTFIANQELDYAKAIQLIENGNADAIAFGKLFIANHDLVERFRDNLVLNLVDAETFYSGGSKGYLP